MPIALSSAPIVGRDKHTSNAISVVSDTLGAREIRERLQGHDHDGEETSVSAGEQDVQGDLVRRLATLGASTRLIIRSRNDLPGSCGDLDHDPVRHTRVPPVTAERSPPDSADHRGGLARRSPTRPQTRCPRSTRPVAGDDLTGHDNDDVPAWPDRDAATSRPSCVRRRRWSRRGMGAAPRPARGRGPSASASARLANTTVSHNQIAIVR